MPRRVWSDLGYSFTTYNLGLTTKIGLTTKKRAEPQNEVHRKCHAVRLGNAPCFSLSTPGDGGQTLFVSVEERVRSR